MQYRVEIDGLRAIAVLPVILYHAGFAAFGGGFVGVDVFFVISGYLITTLILTEKQAGHFSLLRFYERRARRILPALFFVIMCCIPVAWALMSSKQLQDFGQSMAAVAVFGSNVLFWNESGYFEAPAAEKPLLHTWSLAVEEQYYLLFPLFIIIAWRLGPRAVAALMLIGALASLGLAEWGWRYYPEANFYLLPTRGWELLMGALAAMLLNWRGAPGTRVNGIASGLGLALILLSVAGFSRATPIPSLYGLVPTLGTALIIVFATPGTLVNRLLSLPLLAGIGLISYSAYLWHHPLFAFARLAQPEPPSTMALLFLAGLSVVMAYFTWRFIEIPCRNRTAVKLPHLLAGATLSAAVILSIGLTAHLSNGLESLRPAEERQLASTAVASPMREKCHTEGLDYLQPKSACRYFGSRTTWAVLGDSHGVELAYALANQLKAKDEGLIHLTFSGCGPAFTYQSRRLGCTQWTRNAIDFLSRSRPELQNILMIYRYDDDPTAEYIESLRQMVRKLRNAGKRVIVLLPIPSLPSDISRYYRYAMSDGDAEGQSVKEHKADYQEILTALNGLSSEPMITLVNPDEVLCDKVECYAIRDGKSLYFDDQHLSNYGAAQVVDEIIRQLRVENRRSSVDPQHRLNEPSAPVHGI